MTIKSVHYIKDGHAKQIEVSWNVKYKKRVLFGNMLRESIAAFLNIDFSDIAAITYKAKDNELTNI